MRMRIGRSLLEQIAVAHPDARRSQPKNLSLLLLITVEEGPGIRDMNGSWEDPSLQALLPQVLSELGWKTVEHAARRTLVLRIRAGQGEPGVWSCDADRGHGFEAVEVVDSQAAVDLESEARRVKHA